MKLTLAENMAYLSYFIFLFALFFILNKVRLNWHKRDAILEDSD